MLTKYAALICLALTGVLCLTLITGCTAINYGIGKELDNKHSADLALPLDSLDHHVAAGDTLHVWTIHAKKYTGFVEAIHQNDHLILQMGAPGKASIQRVFDWDELYRVSFEDIKTSGGTIALVTLGVATDLTALIILSFLIFYPLGVFWFL